MRTFLKVKWTMNRWPEAPRFVGSSSLVRISWHDKQNKIHASGQWYPLMESNGFTRHTAVHGTNCPDKYKTDILQSPVCCFEIQVWTLQSHCQFDCEVAAEGPH